MALILKDANILTMRSDRPFLTGDIVIEGSTVRQVGGTAPPSTGTDEILDLRGKIVIPGFIQTHTHVCQTLLRNQADDKPLLEWLSDFVWPFEAAHDAQSLYACAQLGILELLDSGTTTILDMGTVHHTDSIFEAAADLGIRAFIGKTMMDRTDPRVPRRLQEDTRDSLREAERLADTWHGESDGRLSYAYAPRFVPSCTEECLRESALRAHALGTPLHTHASENRDEIALVRDLTGRGNIDYLRDVGVLGAGAALAHCVHVSADEIQTLAETRTSVTHCPSSNLKLASGIAPIPEMLAHDVNVALGADGAACNNNLDMLTEMRLAALLHKPTHGAAAMPANTVLRLATVGGATALGATNVIGTIEPGKLADLTVLDLEQLHTAPGGDVPSQIVYSARASDVHTVIVNGRILKKAGAWEFADADRIRALGLEAHRAMRARM